MQGRNLTTDGRLTRNQAVSPDPRPEGPGRIVTRLFPVYALLSLILIFELPYFVPLAPSASDSYLFGYNNRVGVVLLLILAAIGVVWTRGFRLNRPAAPSSEGVSRRALVVSLLLVLLGCAVMFLLVGKLGGFGESPYEIDRVWLTSIGKRPYIDFEWPFGAALLYGPLALHRLLALTIPQSYYLFWAVNCLFGVWLLYATLNAIDFPSRRKSSVFLLLVVAWLPTIMTTGTHYTLTRYVLPLYFIVLFQRGIRPGDKSAYALNILQACAFTAILLLDSPETAIAFALAAVGVFLLAARQRSSAFVFACLCLTVLLAALFAIAWRLHVLDTVVASGGGADSFPIIPSPHILLFFAAFFLALGCVWRMLLHREFSDPSLGLVAVAVPMLPAALGRCDPGHVLMNGLGIFLIALLCASASNFWKYASVAFVVVFMVLAQIGGLWFYMPPLARCTLRLVAEHSQSGTLRGSLMRAGNFYIDHFAAPNSRPRWHQHLQALLSGADPGLQENSLPFPSWPGGYLAPFGYKPDGFGTDLDPRVDYGRFENVENANTPAAIDEKIAELRNSPAKALIIPNQYLPMCQFDVPGERLEIEFLFTAPYRRSPAHPGNPRQALCAWIRNHYTMAVEPTPGTFDYGLWINRDLAKAASR